MNGKSSRPLRKSVGWSSDLIVRPDTPLTNAQRKEFARTVKRAKRDGKIAATAQQTIPYVEMCRDGICKVNSRLYTTSIAFEDINYQLAENDDKTAIFENWCDFVNYLESSIFVQLSFINQ